MQESIYIYSTSQSLDTPSNSKFFIYLNVFYIVDVYCTEDIKTIKEHIRNYLVNKKMFKKSRILFIFCWLLQNAVVAMLVKCALNSE